MHGMYNTYVCPPHPPKKSCRGYELYCDICTINNLCTLDQDCSAAVK